MVNVGLESKTVIDLLVTTEAVIRDLDRWEYVYEKFLFDNGGAMCRYRDDRGAPSCLIGHVLYRWGVLDQVEEGSAITSLYYLGASEALGEVAQAIQNAQDMDETWGEALREGHHAARTVEVEL